MGKRHDGWQLLRVPVGMLDDEAGYSLEVAEVVGEDVVAVGDGRRGDQQVIRPDESSGGAELSQELVSSQ